MITFAAAPKVKKLILLLVHAFRAEHKREKFVSCGGEILWDNFVVDLTWLFSHEPALQCAGNCGKHGI